MSMICCIFASELNVSVMSRLTDIIIGGVSSCILALCMVSCSINIGHTSGNDGEVYVNGVRYVPAEEATTYVPGRMVEHTFDIPGAYESVVVKGALNVVFSQAGAGDGCGISGRVPENLIDRFDVRVEDGSLVLSMKEGVYKFTSSTTPVIYVSNRTLSNVVLSGSSNFSIDGELDTSGADFSAKTTGRSDFKSGRIITGGGHFSFVSSGSADVDIAGVDCRMFNVVTSGSAVVKCGTVNASTSSVAVSGAGNVYVAGATESVQFVVSGSGNIKAGDFKAGSGNVVVSGSGNITCDVEHLTRHVSGSGNIRNRH